jgi:serine carboxypeptidase 1
MEIGPLDDELKPRATTWLTKADLLFVDNPVGTGFSFVEDGDRSLMVRTDAEAARDLTTLLCALYHGNARLRESPLYIVAESYGGKFAVTTALAALKAIQQGRLQAKIQGVALGDSCISPLDFVMSWGPLLYQVSRIDEDGLRQTNDVAMKIQEQLHNNQYKEAEASWSELESVVNANSNSIDFYNFLKDDAQEAPATTTQIVRGRSLAASFSFRTKNGYSGYLSSKASVARPGGFSGLMNTVIKDKLGIIPQNVR